MRFHGHALSEAMCFGIGGGLGIWYLSPSGTTPSRMIHARSEDLEEQFLNGLDIHFHGSAISLLKKVKPLFAGFWMRQTSNYSDGYFPPALL